ncbi:MAG: type II toxin-antitoxin system VapC family toxin [Acidobacteria bacterium]|nr:type II toxin-antitoxin system VapC family toxin [Acidobacteriota bacterium]
MSRRNVVDSSGWLEFLTGSSRSRIFLPAIKDTKNLVVPVISVYEVVKRILREGDEADARNAIQAMTLGQTVDIDLSLALEAARYKLPMADSIIYATAQYHQATLWTQDEDFEGLPGVRYFPK